MTTLRDNNVFKNRTPKTVSGQEIGYSVDIQADTIKIWNKQKRHTSADLHVGLPWKFIYARCIESETIWA